MALGESLIEELGIGPVWVRRAAATAPAMQADALAAVPGGDAESMAAAVAPATERVEARASLPRHAAVQPEGAKVEAAKSEDAKSDAARSELANSEPAPSKLAPSERAKSELAKSEFAKSDPEPAKSAPAQSAPDLPPLDAYDDLPWADEAPAVPEPALADAPGDLDIPTLDWDALADRVANCQRCRLCERRTNTVFGVGDREADWMLIGEAPGENEDKQGEPFVGQAGKLLDNMLRALTLSRVSNVYIANVIKCRPPGNRNPEPDEVARCEPYLQRQVALVKPKVIVAMGRFAAQSLLKSDASIASLRGRVHAYQGVPVIVTYHPAYLLRSLQDKSKAWADLCLARATHRDALTALGVQPGADEGARQGSGKGGR
ncbi:uracil-DNA glycosylase family protein [Caballeronia sp. LZ035]|uniref:uracil-DNA glycosylase family protein n=1 Tax=Caballeronia sp. LZ035 TaxID=3038568 RepID=UPI002862808A|nr:uracil-DNA glycosylase family protein [Caballeronia sp. LZ035]MDR5756792.1 uracil-DNA glycosylase family protein [Caballeronia sp. LZ035]